VVVRGGEPAIDPRLLVLREVVADVAALVQRAPLDERGVAEHLAHRGGEGLAPSITTSSPPSVVRPRATRSASGAVTTVLFSVSPNHRPTGTLVPSAPIASATTHQASAKCTPSSINAARSSSEGSRLINSSSCVGGGLEPAAHRRTGRRPGLRVEVVADRFVHPSVPAVASPASIRSITTCDSRSSLAERGVGGELDLVARNGAAPWPLDRHASAAQHDRPGRAPMPVSLPLRELGVLRAADPGDRPDGQQQRAFFIGGGPLPLSVDLAVARHLPRRQVSGGDHHLTSTRPGDNLRCYALLLQVASDHRLRSEVFSFAPEAASP
jgi:hypothetical protein